MPRLTNAQRALIHRRLRTAGSEGLTTSNGELNVIPFLDIVVNLIMFLLVTVALAAVITQIDITLPEYHRPGGRRALNLMVSLTDRGIVVAGAGGKLMEGCDRTTTGPAIAVPGRPGHYDFRTLTGCLARVKARFPSETEVVVTADPGVRYDDFVAAMDASRGDPDRELFPRVLVGAGVR